jgi:aryl carrier-like protein
MAAGAVPDPRALSPEEAVGLLDRVLDTGLSHVVISTVSLRARIAAAHAAPAPAPAVPGPRAARPALATDFVAPAPGAESRLAAVWQDVLGVAEVGALDNFFELGGDSLTALSFTARYLESTGVRLAVTALYEAPTVRLLARALDSLPSGPRPPES